MPNTFFLVDIGAAVEVGITRISREAKLLVVPRPSFYSVRGCPTSTVGSNKWKIRNISFIAGFEKNQGLMCFSKWPPGSSTITGAVSTTISIKGLIHRGDATALKMNSIGLRCGGRDDHAIDDNVAGRVPRRHHLRRTSQQQEGTHRGADQ